MKLVLDTNKGELTATQDGRELTIPLYSPEAFDLLSRQWVKLGWQLRYSYSFTWLGRPIIQMPEDLVRIQEVIYRTQPDVIVETGVAHGGSLIYYAGLCKIMERGRVIGVDIQIRPQNRAAIEGHALASYITLLEGSSTAPETVARIGETIRPGEKVLVILDSCHTKDHVAAELAAYAPLVSVGSYVVATDGIMADLVGVPRAGDDWGWNNPQQAAIEFASSNSNFELADPPLIFNESLVATRVTHWPSAYLKRVA
jgi:cephalosporin hydroxylase